MGNPRNVGGIRSRSGRRRAIAEHYLTAREAGLIAKRQRRKAEKRGIFRRWNDRKLTPEEQAMVARVKKNAQRRARKKTSLPKT